MPETNHGIPYPGPMPVPTPEHQRKITRGKWFEIITVVSLILAGTAFLAWRKHASTAPDPSVAMSESVKAVAAADCLPDGTTTLFKRQFLSFKKPLDGFECHVDLVGATLEAPIDAAIVWLTPLPGKALTPEALQFAVNSAGQLGQTIVPTIGQALVNASNTMTFEDDAKRPHDKGVSVTDDGWKLTYVTYRSYDEAGTPPPMLCLILHRLSAASDDTLGLLNRSLYEALNQGADLKTALRAAEGAPAAN